MGNELTYVRPLTEEEQRLVRSTYGVTYYKYVVAKSVSVTIPSGHKVTIPLGFLCDGASGPGIDSFQELGWLLHDWLYATHSCDNDHPITKDEADAVLNPLRELAVHLFGDHAWEDSFRRGPQFLPKIGGPFEQQWSEYLRKAFKSS